MHLRTSKRPPLESKNRNDLTSTQCREADAFLKELRSCAQQLSPLETTLNDELRILERLYYKGVNQHRSALFWRRVEEMRKFGRRIAEMKLALMVEDLRFAFYLPEGAERQSKVLRTPWTQIPSMKFVTFFRNRIHEARGLLDESLSRYRKAYQSFTLMLQTGTFLQTILLLAAIASRLNALSIGLHSVVETVGKSIHALVAVTDMKSTIEPKQSEPSGSRDGFTPNVNEEEDIDQLSSIRNDSAKEKSIAFPWTAEIEEAMEVDGQPSNASLAAPESVITFATHPQPPPAKVEGLKAKVKEVKKKKKKKPDFIDDIFGSLF